MKFDIHKILIDFLIVLTFSIGILYSYQSQIAGENEYMGMQLILFDIGYMVTFIFGVVAATLLLPRSVKLPSQIFSYIYIVIVFVPYIAINSCRGGFQFANQIVLFTLLVLPLLVVKAVSRFQVSIAAKPIISQGFGIAIIALVCILGIVFSILYAPSSAGFGLSDTYERRLEGREVFKPRSANAYIMMMCGNCFSPALLFVSVLKKIKLGVIIAVTAGVAIYYSIGIKGTFYLLIMAWLLAISVRNGRINQFKHSVNFFVISALLLFSVERFVFGESFVVGDNILRRTFAVPPLLMNLYIEAVLNDAFTNWSWLLGTPDRDVITYIVGRYIFNSDTANANTNAFIISFASWGLTGYLSSVLVIGVIYLILDTIYSNHKNTLVLYAGFAFCFIVSEQALPTALVSSGFGFLIMMCSMFNLSSEFPLIEGDLPRSARSF